MNILNNKFFNGLINFDTFSRLPPNTDIHLSKNTGLFTPNAGKMSGIIGAQTISNLYNGYTPDQMINDLDTFVVDFIDVIDQLYRLALEDKLLREEISCKIAILSRDFKNAYGNEKHGLVCLLNTYIGTIYYDRLTDLLHFLKDHISKYKKLSKWYNHFNDNFENNFKDEDWEYYIQNSKSLQYETTSLYKFYIQYSSSLLYNQTMNNIGIWHWYDLIHEFEDGVKIYLGGMPLKSGALNIENRNDLITLQNMGVQAILSVVEGFENKSEGYIYTPITPNEWEDVNIKLCQIPIPDFGTVSLNKIHTCVEYIHWNIKNKRSVYTSCRVGRNRSNLVLMAYFVKYLKYTSQEAYDYIKFNRFQIQNKHFKILQQYEQLVTKYK